MSNYAGILPPASPSRGQAYAGVLAQMIAQQNAEQGSADQAYRTGFLAKWNQLLPQEQADAYQHLGPREKAILDATGQMAVQRPMNSGELKEMNNRAVLSVGGQATPSPQLPTDEQGRFSPSSAIMAMAPRTGGAGDPISAITQLLQKYRLETGADLPKDVTDAALTNQLQGPTGLQQANAISNKMALSAQEGVQKSENERDFSKIKYPESLVKIGKEKAETGKIGAETTKARAETTKIGAETGKIGEEVRGLKRTNEFFQPQAAAPTARAADGRPIRVSDDGTRWVYVDTGLPVQ